MYVASAVLLLKSNRARIRNVILVSVTEALRVNVLQIDHTILSTMVNSV